MLWCSSKNPFRYLLGNVLTCPSHEYMRELGGLSFFAENPKWREGDVVTTVMKHGQKMYGEYNGFPSNETVFRG